MRYHTPYDSMGAPVMPLIDLDAMLELWNYCDPTGSDTVCLRMIEAGTRYRVVSGAGPQRNWWIMRPDGYGLCDRAGRLRTFTKREDAVRCLRRHRRSTYNVGRSRHPAEEYIPDEHTRNLV